MISNYSKLPFMRRERSMAQIVWDQKIDVQQIDVQDYQT
jgi:hypothetical protein